MYYTYMLRCEDNSIYTGITTDIERRVNEHLSKNEKCAKYTLTHTAKKLECAWQTDTRKQASKLEYYIKRLTKQEKENLIKDNTVFTKYFSKHIDCEEYMRCLNNVV